MNDETLKYYDQNADAFVQGTISVNFSDIQERFQCALHGNSVLDFGCGSGRDTKKFEDLNFQLEGNCVCQGQSCQRQCGASFTYKEDCGYHPCSNALYF